MNKTKFIFFSIVCLLTFAQCKTKSKAVILYQEGTPFQKLSEYNFFKGKISDLIPNENVLPYDVATPLFTDYAEKARFVWMPKGTSANYTKDEALDFPEGTILIKNFYYWNDFRDHSKGKKIIETRLLVKEKKGWNTNNYLWNDAQTDATLDVVGKTIPIKWINEKGEQMGTNYSVPNKNQCKNCHNFNNTFMPIGPKVRNLNHDFTYQEGTKNQMEKWTEIGYLKGFVAADNIHNKLPKWNDPKSGTLEQRAKAYLESNCAHCHRPEGNANTSGLFLLTTDHNPESWGIMKSPVAAGKGSGNRLFDIVPGKPEASILTFRMESLDVDAMMPEIGRTMVHIEGVQLIKDWIANMPQ
ncbi:MAG: SO2930 family diheme c-type cytochrome [Chitinophagales bacterium]